MLRTDTRGMLLLEMAARLGLIVINKVSIPTYRRPGFGNSIPDITLMSERLAAKEQGWRVIEDYTGSDHQYLVFQIRDKEIQDTREDHLTRRYKRWNAAKMDKGKLQRAIQDSLESIPQLPVGPPDKAQTDTLVEATMNLITKACNASMPIKRRGNGPMK